MINLFKKALGVVRHVFLYFCIVSLLWGCSSNPPWQADVSDVPKPDISISRYEQVLFTINPFALRQEIDPYIEEFYFFLGDAIDTPEGQQQLYEYITDPFLKEIYLDVQQQWPDTDDLESSLNQAFRYYQYHFPQNQLPSVFTYISGLDYNLPVKYAMDHLVIGLDMYLGPEYQNYNKAAIPGYMKHRLTPAHTAVDVLRIMGEHHIQQHDPKPETLLDFMVYEGKVLYFIDCMFPSVNDTLKVPYTNEQLQWMEKNSGYVWSYYIENEMIYSTDRQMINKFIGEAPFTAAFSERSAPRTGSWHGWQMVREYMRRNPEVSLQDLLREQDSGKILVESRYRPA